MFKLFIATLLTLSINTVGIQKSQAAVAGIVSLTGGSGAAAIALTGLGVAAGGTLFASSMGNANGGHEDVGVMVLSLLLGLVLLEDENIVKIDLNLVETKKFSLARLTRSEITAIKNNQEELEAVFTEAMKDRHVDLAAARFEEAKAILGEDTITGLHKLLTTQI